MTMSGRLPGVIALLVVSLVVCFSLCLNAVAADEDTAAATFPEYIASGGDARTDADEAPNLTVATVKILVALCVVLALVVGLALVLKRVTYRLRHVGGGTISIMSQVPLGPTQFLTVVDIAGEVVVLGVTEHTVTALSSIEDAAAVERLREESSGSGKAGSLLPGVPSFRQWLDRAERGRG
jgi:flagellar protein FliO/FliZ